MTFQVGNHEAEFHWNYGILLGFEIVPWHDIHNQGRVQHVRFSLALGVFTFAFTFQVREQS